MTEASAPLAPAYAATRSLDDLNRAFGVYSPSTRAELEAVADRRLTAPLWRALAVEIDRSRR